jgi:hypothetical protein
VYTFTWRLQDTKVWQCVRAEVALAAASGAGAVEPDTTPAAKSTRLTPEAEATLLSFFSLQDTLTKEAASVLAQQV